MIVEKIPINIAFLGIFLILFRQITLFINRIINKVHIYNVVDEFIQIKKVTFKSIK